LSPTQALRSIGTGCTFDWVSDEAIGEANALLDPDPYARAQLAVLVDLLKRGVVRKGKDYRQMVIVEDEPPLYELRLRTTTPELRLYFIEESHHDGVHVIGLMLAPKPSGTPAEQRIAQNLDATNAYERRPDS